MLRAFDSFRTAKRTLSINWQKNDDMTMSKGHILRAMIWRYRTCRYAIMEVLGQLEVAGLIEMIECKILGIFRQLLSMVNTEGEGGEGGSELQK